ncbi:hypothetical protein ESCO_005590 [Escovopsis weberi]|uniref:DUF6603 domain-containing protein n=1 Tax=Escovopsis weberi TaxID=150374 RepID=A0A0M8N4Q4_ESCWE|nr:hypothetical protein ESCO_005590 [Escovopsis weberi]
MQTTVRLQFQIANFGDLQTLLSDVLSGFTLVSADAICKKKVVRAQTVEGEAALDQGSVALALKCSVQAPGAESVSLEAALEFFPSAMALTFDFPSNGSFSGMIKWLASLIGDSTLETFVNDILGKQENGRKPYLGDVAIDASFDWGNGSAFNLLVSISAGIEPSATSVNKNPALFVGSLAYDSKEKKWELNASLTGLYASTLLEFFDDEAKEHVGAFLNTIAIDTLSVNYIYQPAAGGTSKGSEFTISGDLLIATLRLQLGFNYKTDGWKFNAALKPQQQDAKIGDVLKGLLGSTDDLELPDFVSNMVLVGNDSKVFGLDVLKKDTSFQFMAQLNIGKLSVAFAQLHSTDWGADKPSKRLIEVAISGFPDLKVDIPLIGELQQPLDELYFLWVQDKSVQPGKIGGFTRKDLLQINGGLQDPILVKDTIKEEQRKDTDMLVAAGCHFSVIVRGPTGERSCLLDYEFMKPSVTSSTKAIEPGTSTSAEPKSLKASNDDDGGPTAQAPYKKTAGPLSINNVGLKYKNKKLAIMFDATLEMGPIGFTLIGFSLQADFKTLDEVPALSADIEGLSAAFEKPPLTLAGIIRHGNDGKLDYYAGGLIVGWTVYQFQAAGFYGMVTTAGYDPYRSVFVFAKLDGPLVTLEFAEISGICGGFGYNSNVRVPTIDEIYQFPFIASSDLGNAQNALEALKKLTDPGPAGWFSPLDKTYWAAVGMKVDAFKMLSFDAVLVVQFGQAIKLGLFALVIADVPTADSPIKLAHVELGISAVADMQYGTLKVEAQLSPRSFIFDQSCHLTGGMGLYYWFDAPEADKSNVGNFVFTIGGYHQAFDVPVGFPNPPRLGISWSLGSTLSISGQAYFAITPKACMAGGRLHASFSAGPIGAWFDAFADFLINYKPFHFNAAAGISVGVYVEIKILFIHIKISVEIGAQLYLWGPPVAGRVHVDLWVVSFDINFGDSESGVPPITLLEFYNLVLQASESQEAASSAMLAMASGAAEEEEEEKAMVLADKPPKNEGHNFLPVSGLLNDNDKPDRQPNEPWVVRAGTFSLVVACKMAINSFKKDPNEEPILTYADPYSKPMKLTTGMSSTLVVSVQQDGTPKPDDGWQYEIYTKEVPRALWDKYNPSEDPSGGKNNIGDLLNGDGSSLTLMMGVQMTAPPATMAPDPFPPFDIAKADLQPIWSERPFPAFANADPAWAPAKPFEGDDVGKQYEAVYDTWTKPGWGTGDDGQAGFVEIFAKSLNWVGADALKKIAGLPARLGVKDAFMNSYIAAPMLST